MLLRQGLPVASLVLIRHLITCLAQFVHRGDENDIYAMSVDAVATWGSKPAQLFCQSRTCGRHLRHRIVSDGIVMNFTTAGDFMSDLQLRINESALFGPVILTARIRSDGSSLTANSGIDLHQMLNLLSKYNMRFGLVLKLPNMDTAEKTIDFLLKHGRSFSGTVWLHMDVFTANSGNELAQQYLRLTQAKIRDATVSLGWISTPIKFGWPEIVQMYEAAEPYVGNRSGGIVFELDVTSVRQNAAKLCWLLRIGARLGSIYWLQIVAQESFQFERADIDWILALRELCSNHLIIYYNLPEPMATNVTYAFISVEYPPKKMTTPDEKLPGLFNFHLFQGSHIDIYGSAAAMLPNDSEIRVRQYYYPIANTSILTATIEFVNTKQPLVACLLGRCIEIRPSGSLKIRPPKSKPVSSRSQGIDSQCSVTPSSHYQCFWFNMTVEEAWLHSWRCEDAYADDSFEHGDCSVTFDTGIVYSPESENQTFLKLDNPLKTKEAIIFHKLNLVDPQAGAASHFVLALTQMLFLSFAFVNFLTY